MRRIGRFISCWLLLTVVMGIGGREACLAKGKVIGKLLDGYQQNCKVVRSGKEISVFQEMELYDGDVIIKTPDVKELNILYFPYARYEKKSKTELLLVFDPPAQKAGLLRQVQAILNFENQHLVVSGGSRDGLYTLLKMNGDFFTGGPFPGATLLADGKTRFFINKGTNEMVTFYDGNRQELCRVKPENGMVELDAGGVKLNPGQNYYWRLGDSGSYIPITILQPEIEEEITAALKRIAGSGRSEIAVQLNQVTYLLAISDVYPGQLDLNWLGYQMLREIAFSNAPLTDDDSDKFNLLLKQVYINKIQYKAVRL
jgi:hypothetical protein